MGSTWCRGLDPYEAIAHGSSLGTVRVTRLAKAGARTQARAQAIGHYVAGLDPGHDAIKELFRLHVGTISRSTWR